MTPDPILPGIAARASWTERAREKACRRVGRDGHAVAVISGGVGRGDGRGARARYSPCLRRNSWASRPVPIGVDETAFTRASAIKPTVFATGVIDLERGRLIDVVEGRRLGFASSA